MASMKVSSAEEAHTLDQVLSLAIDCTECAIVWLALALEDA